MITHTDGRLYKNCDECRRIHGMKGPCKGRPTCFPCKEAGVSCRFSAKPHFTRQRRGRTCIECRNRKRRCDGQRRCRNCAEEGAKCTYESIHARNINKQVNNKRLLIKCIRCSYHSLHCSGGVPCRICQKLKKQCNYPLAREMDEESDTDGAYETDDEQEPMIRTSPDHRKVTVYRCEKCSRPYKDKRDLDQHLRSHLHLKCSFDSCASKFYVSRNVLEEHQLRVSSRHNCFLAWLTDVGSHRT